MIGKVLQDDELVPDRLGRLYYQTAAFTRLSDAIRQTYRSILERFREEYRERPVARIEEQHIAAILDKKADTPAAANHLRLLLRALMKLARKRKLITVNPMIEIEPIRYKVKGFKAWSDGEIKLFADRYPIGTRERLALEPLLCAAPRRSDVVRLGPQDLSGGRLRFALRSRRWNAIPRQRTGRGSRTVPRQPSRRRRSGLLRTENLGPYWLTLSMVLWTTTPWS